MFTKKSRLKFLLHNKTLTKRFVNKLFIKQKKGLTKDQFYNRKLSYLFNYKFNCTTPTTFNEYLVWIKLNYSNELWKTCSDKIACKKYLEDKGYKDYLPKTYGIYHHSQEINLDILPEKFVLKTNHDSGSIFICEKGKTDFVKIFKLLDESIAHNYSEFSDEWVYKDIKPLIFAEELLYPAIGMELIDYKFFIINKKFRFGFTAQDRATDTRFMLFEDNFKEIKDCEYIFIKPSKNKKPAKPVCYQEMVNLAEKIGEDFEIVRVDLYWTTAGIKIGELTFLSNGGHGPFTNKKYEYKYGSYFKETSLYNLSHKKTI